MIFFSSRVYREDIGRSLKAGADDFLAELFNEHEYITMINERSSKNIVDSNTVDALKSF